MSGGDFFKPIHILPVYHQLTDAIAVTTGQTIMV